MCFGSVQTFKVTATETFGSLGKRVLFSPLVQHNMSPNDGTVLNFMDENFRNFADDEVVTQALARTYTKAVAIRLSHPHPNGTSASRLRPNDQRQGSQDRPPYAGNYFSSGPSWANPTSGQAPSTPAGPGFFNFGDTRGGSSSSAPTSSGVKFA